MKQSTPKPFWRSWLIRLSLTQAFLNAVVAVLMGAAPGVVPVWVLLVLNAICSGLGAVVVMLRTLDIKGAAALVNGSVLALLLLAASACSPMQCKVQDDLIEAHPTKPYPAGRRLHRCDGKVYLEVLADNVGRCEVKK